MENTKARAIEDTTKITKVVFLGYIRRDGETATSTDTIKDNELSIAPSQSQIRDQQDIDTLQTEENQPSEFQPSEFQPSEFQPSDAAEDSSIKAHQETVDDDNNIKSKIEDFFEGKETEDYCPFGNKQPVICEWHSSLANQSSSVDHISNFQACPRVKSVEILRFFKFQV
ncbi:1593_t:CDS:2 [Ambispora leptoticha]|uniref:1593_t:CDS:1 n=1 Tax=Ambispora leptoticha TaxID=144679 RepID=A0A9N9BLR5_9GLOM|nr:1593_t:CDS:2 [Ambispora leptoticha]